MSAFSTVLNVGLNVGDRETLTPRQVLAAVALAGGVVLAADVRQSDSERTVIAALAEPLSEPALHRLAETLDQEAVAMRHGDGGIVAGPQAHLWGTFNPAYFLDLDTPEVRAA